MSFSYAAHAIMRCALPGPFGVLVTVTASVPLTPEYEAEIVDEPTETAVTAPALETEVAELDDDQVAELVTFVVVESLSVAVAVRAPVRPIPFSAAVPVIVIDFTVVTDGVLTGGIGEPQARVIVRERNATERRRILTKSMAEAMCITA
jgi:hypothetical protein